MLENARNLAENLVRPFLYSSFVHRLKNFLKNFFLRSLAPVSLALASSIPVLGLEHSCPWPREGLSPEGLFLALGFFFVSLALASSLASSTPPLPGSFISFPQKFLCPPKHTILAPGLLLHCFTCSEQTILIADKSYYFVLLNARIS